ncbi:transferase family-domain-containing protein [Fusarium redolens]|uniref:Transferase family-domain-containing protein n=1 Tax=Fusarium redolens TaxID=48865 RepID=A0A9P9G2T9_FUSRE|nr:transferase family-domain-containing protein [Fusarium redolens]KAH7230227.1 transferase family-domain-containing protein [Fusarium redolens]
MSYSSVSNVGNPRIEPLTALDALMPKNYIRVLLAFRTSEPFNVVSQQLQCGLNATTEKIPWISGQVRSAGNGNKRAAHGAIHYSSDSGSPQIIDCGSIDKPFSSLEAHAMHSTTIPENVWPLGALPGSDDSLVFGASVFRFKDDQGLGLCVCMHHHAVDAAGFTEVLRIWAQETTTRGSSTSQSGGTRLSRVSEALASQISEASSKNTEQLFSLLPEYSPIPPAMPASFPSFGSQMFTIPTEHLDAYKQVLAPLLEKPPSTNTVLCALLWSFITRIRAQHKENTLAHTSSRLVMAVNGRRRIGPNFSPPDNPYIGNLVLYASAERPFDTLKHAAASARDHAEVCNTITQSFAPAKINSQHIANVFELGRQARDCSTIFPGWDFFNHRDVTITSWADLDLYQVGWGSELGQPEFVRFPFSAADGVCIILPRRRVESASHSKNLVEVVIMLKAEHLEALKTDSLWQSLVGAQ